MKGMVPIMNFKNVQYETDHMSYNHLTQLIKGETLYTNHSHNYYEVYIFLSGRGKMIIEGTTYPLKPYTVAIMRPLEFHRLLLEDMCQYERITIEFSKEFLNHLDENEQLYVPFHERSLGITNVFSPIQVQSSDIMYYISKIEQALISEYDLKDIIMKVNFASLLIELSNLFTPIHNNENTLSIDSDFPPVVKDVILYINDNITSDLSLDILSTQFYFSKYYLSRVFATATGHTLHEYIMKKRLLIAKQQIREGYTTIDACHSSGFRDYSSFYKAYKKFFSISPKEESVNP